MSPRTKRRLTTSGGDAPPDTGAASAEQQPSRRTLRGKRGGLANMPDMPMDILLEIFSYLHPRDLLNLARTSKDFRKYLMSREFAFLWKVVRKSIDDFPDCPSYLSEPAYANLAFFPHCHSCLKGNIKTVLWALCARYCNNCLQSKTSRYSNGFPSYPQNLHISTLVLYLRANRFHVYLKDEVNSVVEKLRAVAGDPVKERLYIAERNALVQEKLKHSEQCSLWFKSKSSSRAKELQAIRDDRFAAAGWGEELEYMKREKYRNFLPENAAISAQIRVPKPLNDRAWSKMHHELTVQMEDVRKERLREEREKIFRVRFNALAQFVYHETYSKTACTANTDSLPRAVDFAYMQEFRDILDSPSSVTVTIESFDVLRNSFTTLTARWQADVKAEFTSLVSEYLDVPDGSDVLGLAVAVFGCNGCQQSGFRYPAVVAHTCFRPIAFESWIELPEFDKLVAKASATKRWSRAKASCMFARVRPVLQACGMPLESTTAEEMDRLDYRFRLVDPSEPHDTDFELGVEGLSSLGSRCDAFS
ncbi:hypothetical protein B0H21DRAFT_767734 [Amylocystis lapponica]|nr:hypothetical protein B0H21DRAFT_767734 [Amylocystis lapponica]